MWSIPIPILLSIIEWEGDFIVLFVHTSEA